MLAEGRHTFGRRPWPRAAKRWGALLTVTGRFDTSLGMQSSCKFETIYEVNESFVQFHCLCSSPNDRSPFSQAISFGKLISRKCGHLPGSHLRQNDIT